MTQFSLDTLVNITNVTRLEYLSCLEKEVVSRTLISYNQSAPLNDVRDKENELFDILSEIKEMKRDIEDLSDSIETYYDQMSVNKRTELKNIKINEMYLAESEKIESEINDLMKQIEKNEKYNETLAKRQEHHLKKQTFESQRNLINNDYKILDQIFKSQTMMIDSIKSHAERSNQLETISLKKYSITEMLTDIKIFEESDSESSTNTNVSSWYNIMFLSLPDELMEEKKGEETPDITKSLLDKLSVGMLDKYRSMQRKRKMAQGDTAHKGYLCVNNLKDFQVIYDIYVQLVCFNQTKQEVVNARAKFPIDWIDGSQVVNILLGTSMATILLPKYYPLIGTSRIKLLSFKGRVDSAVKKFKIDQNFDSFSDWVSHFIDMYNKNLICPL